MPSPGSRCLTDAAAVWVHQCKPSAGAQVKQQLRKMKEKAISRGKWQGSGGPKGAPSIREDQEIVSELAEWEVGCKVSGHTVERNVVSCCTCSVHCATRAPACWSRAPG